MKNQKIFGKEILLISALFIFIGMAGIVWIFGTAYFDSEVQEALKGEGSLVLSVLDVVGIIFPVLVIGLGARFIQLGLHLYQQKIESIRWTQMSLLWLTIGSVFLAIFLLLTRSQGDSTAGIPFSWTRGIVNAVPWAVLGVLCAISLTWFLRQSDVIMRDETLAKRNVRMAWNLLMPTLAILVIVAARPLEKTFITSLTDKRFAGTAEVQYVGFANYSKLLTMRLDTVECRLLDDGTCRTTPAGAIAWSSIEREYLEAGFRPVTTIPLGGTQALVLSSTDSSFIQAIFNTIQFTVVSVSLELILGLFIALVVNSKFRGRGFIRAVMLVPWAIPTVISARLWELMLRDNQSGIINKILIDLGLQGSSQAWLSSADLQINALIMVDVWKTTPFMALLLLAGLQLIPEDLYEAAAIDGASRVQQFFTVTLPLLRPTIAIALVFRSLDALRAFDVFQVLLGRQKLSMATYNYEVLIQSQQAGYASAVSVIIFVLISIFTITYVRSIKMEGV